MNVVVERKNCWGSVTYEFSVKGDPMEWVACVPCKGTGSCYCTVGGNLWALGWQMYQDFGCPHCKRKGAWKNVAQG